MNRERSSAVVVKVALALLALLAAFPAVSGAQAPVGPPGPPPGNGAALPAAPGTAMSVVPPGTAAALPAGPLGPGLLGDGNVGLSRATRTFSLSFACQAKGSVSIRSRLLSKVTLATSGYRCAANRAKAK